MVTIDGQSLLPYIDGREFTERQLESWKDLKKYQGLTIMLGHGHTFDESGLIKHIENCCAYLEVVLAANGPISYKEAAKNCDCE